MVERFYFEEVNYALSRAKCPKPPAETKKPSLRDIAAEEGISTAISVVPSSRESSGLMSARSVRFSSNA